MDLPLCELEVQIEGSPVQPRIEQVYSELEQRGLRFRPYFWVSEDWFTPQDVPGCAVPFYLLHPRLVRLERRHMLEVEGAGRAECMKLLRHEVGHAIDHAFRLYRRRERQKLFGRSSKHYPKSYGPRPRSRNFVQHLDYWYAQAHPDEDFAETFAVWLSPRSSWRKVYSGWPALKKLEYLDELMYEIQGVKPSITSRERVHPLHRLRMTLGDYYGDKQKKYGSEYPDVFDADLRKLFSSDPRYRGNESAASFLRRVRPQIRRMVSHWTEHYQYTLYQVLKDMAGRCRELNLRLVRSPDATKMDAAIMLTVNTMHFVYRGRRWVDV